MKFRRFLRSLEIISRCANTGRPNDRRNRGRRHYGVYAASALLPRLSLVVIRAADLAQLARFYSALGMSFQAEKHGAGPLHYVSTDTGITFEIYPCSAEEAPTTGTRLGFATVSLDVVLNALTEYGGEIVAPTRGSPWGRRAVVIDPEGHKIEISEQGAVLDGEGRLTPAGETWVEAQRREVEAAFQRHKNSGTTAV